MHPSHGSHAEGPGGGSLGSGSVGISVSAAEGASVGLRDLGSPWLIMDVILSYLFIQFLW